MAEILKTLGLKDGALKSVLKNKKLTKTLCDIVDTASRVSTPEQVTDKGSILYELGTRFKGTEAKREIVIMYIMQGKLDKQKLGYAIEYCNDFGSINLRDFEVYCGVDVIISDDDVDKEVTKVTDKIQPSDWGSWNQVMNTVYNNLKFADRGTIKAHVDFWFKEEFGDRPKSVGRKRPEKKKKAGVVVEEPDVPEFTLPEPFKNNQKDHGLLKAHLERTGGRVVTRFPPEPNGHLHIGHAKAMHIDFSYASRNEGWCYLRFDDTNPLAEKPEYVESIIEDVRWLNHQPHRITFSSDYFDKLYELAVILIQRGGAYVCELSSEELQHGRREGIESPYRNRSVEDNLELFEKMRTGEFEEGSAVLRMKIDMTSDNPNMRDPVAYRIIKAPHYRTGDRWCIYPSYDFTHCIVDSLEDVTHSLCSLEFQSRNESYRWLLDALDMYKPPQIEFGRLNITHCMLSKRKLIRLINDGVVSGWDDPRLPTIKGLRRRGYTPEAINEFADKMGVSIGSGGGEAKFEVLEQCVRLHLDRVAPRVMAVTDPVQVEIVNWSDSFPRQVRALDFPTLRKESSTHPVNFGPIVYIERADFRETDDPNYYRLTPNQKVRLKYAGLIEYVSHTSFAIQVRFLGETGEKVKGTVNWISSGEGSDPLKVETRTYEHLFPDELNEEADWLEQVNVDGTKIHTVYVDDSVRGAKVGDKYQFERIGFFCVDPDSTEDSLIFNQTVSLKESKTKV